jgi:RNA-binding protein
MSLSESQKKHLRGLGHALKPVIMIGDAGLSEGVRSEFKAALEHHELIKVRVRVGDRDARDATFRALCEETGAELIQRVGNVALLYRENPEKKKISLPRG